MQGKPPNPSSIAIIIEPETALPISVPVENADEWNNPEGELQLYYIAQALIAHGFEGVMFKVLATSANGRFMYTMPHDLSSPEGKYIAAMWESARNGQQLPDVDSALVAVRTAYRQAGLPLPNKVSPNGEATR